MSDSPPANFIPDGSASAVGQPGRLRRFARRNFIYILVGSFAAAVLLVATWHRIFFNIPTGHAGVVYRPLGGGTVTYSVRDEGLQVIWPWNTLTVYDVRVSQVQQSFETICSNGLGIVVNVSIQYRPKIELLGFLHKKIGPDYLNKIVVPQVQSLIRTTFGQFTAEEIYTSKRSLIEMTFEKALGELGDKFVEVEGLFITSITLPPSVKVAIEEKLVQEQRVMAMEFRIKFETKEAERKKVEAEGVNAFQAIVGQSLTSDLIKYKSIEALLSLSLSNNAKVILTGGNSVPFILDSHTPEVVPPASQKQGGVAPKAAGVADSKPSAAPLDSESFSPTR